MVYPRRIKAPETTEQHRRLESVANEEGSHFDMNHRRLMFGIDWDKSAAMNKDKEYWAGLRTSAVNSVVGFFGSLNSGSLGWCYQTKYHEVLVDKKKKKRNECNPIMAYQGTLPWLTPEHTAKEQCP